MRHILVVLLVLFPAAAAANNPDVDAARAIFEANIDAIRQKNLDAYLSYYLHSPALVRGGPTGFSTGYDAFAKDRGPWPDSIEANDLRLTPIQPGIVYGTYRYRVRYGADEHSGI